LRVGWVVDRRGGDGGWVRGMMSVGDAVDRWVEKREHPDATIARGDGGVARVKMGSAWWWSGRGTWKFGKEEQGGGGYE